MNPVEIVLRALGFVLLLALAGVLVRTRRRNRIGRLGLALCASVAAFLITSMPRAAELLGTLVYPLAAVCSTHPVWFWIVCSALFTDRFELRPRHVVSVAAMAVTGMLYQASLDPVLGVAFGAASLAFAALAPIVVRLSGPADLEEHRRRIRTWFVPLVAGYVALLTIVQGIVWVAGRPTPPGLVIANLAVIAGVTGLVLASFLRVRVVNWLDAEPMPSRVALGPLDQSVLARLEARFVPERLYAREALSIAVLAGMLGTQEHVLRRVINRGLGHRNFNDFLHSHRLREAAARLRDPAERHLPILTIALDCGYGSIGPFNRAFKERFGMTPGEYRGSAASGERTPSTA
jgi:AraC-like DNA-binding protein